MAGALAASEIRVAGTGAIYVAPVGTAVPTTVNDAFNAAFRNLGFATTDGLRLTRTMDTEQVNSWQSIAVQRYLITGVNLTVAFDLQQYNKDTLPLYLGGGTIVNQGGCPVSYKLDLSSTPTIDERAMIYTWVDGTINNRLVVPRGMVSETGEATLGREQEIRLPLTFSAMSPTSGDGARDAAYGRPSLSPDRVRPWRRSA